MVSIVSNPLTKADPYSGSKVTLRLAGWSVCDVDGCVVGRGACGYRRSFNEGALLATPHKFARSFGFSMQYVR
jgi:hypothetical protein